MKKEPVMAGLVVVDFTQFFAGPIVTQSLAELGAEVIKVEFAPTGDPGRYLPLVKNQRSGYFIQQNTGKKSLCVDLKTTEGKRLVLDLIKKADVLVENYAPGAIARLGFGWDAVRALNPRLIMCSVSAFGQSGPLSNMPGFDFTGQAYSGVASMVGESDGAPALIGLALGDCGTGMSALAAVNAALYRREKTGEGAYVESTLIDFLFRAHEANVEIHSISKGEIAPHRSGSHSSAYAPVGYFKTQNGYISITVPDSHWPRLCQAMAKPELEKDERFATNDTRLKNLSQLVKEIEAWMCSFKSTQDAMATLNQHHIPAAPVLSVAEGLNHPHLIERETVRALDVPILGTIKIGGMPIHFMDQPKHLGGPAPLLGEHNIEILKTHLGLDQARIKKLEHESILHSSHG